MVVIAAVHGGVRQELAEDTESKDNEFRSAASHWSKGVNGSSRSGISQLPNFWVGRPADFACGKMGTPSCRNLSDGTFSAALYDDGGNTRPHGNILFCSIENPLVGTYRFKLRVSTWDNLRICVRRQGPSTGSG